MQVRCWDLLPASDRAHEGAGGDAQLEWHGWYVIGNSENDMRELLKIPDNFKVMFLQGGATTQFASVALNLLGIAKRGPSRR